ncbi:MAG TPA: RHS repeat-associated core domain-containing protein [Verrucomicrobiae bacterium]|nr:RHS repeat-associated core domain-containing protein [Verrucomicrobiae bacterium]
MELTQWTNGERLSSLFSYDGFGRRVKIIEETNGVAGSTSQFVWSGTQLCEERDGNNNVTKQFFANGEKIGGMLYYFTKDHLGSIREMTDDGGMIRARYDYDPYGRRTKVQGDRDADFGYTGYYVHQASGLQLALYRAYDADLGRFINRDPIGEAGGINLYDYAQDDPLNRIDPLGFSDVNGPSTTLPGVGGSYSGDFSSFAYPSLPPADGDQGSGGGSDAFALLSTSEGTTGQELSALEYGSGKTTLGDNGKVYFKGFHGNKSVCTQKLSRYARKLGSKASLLGLGMDYAGWQDGDLSGQEAATSATFTALGLTSPAGATLDGEYFLVDTFYPGGAPAFMTNVAGPSSGALVNGSLSSPIWP